MEQPIERSVHPEEPVVPVAVVDEEVGCCITLTV